MKRTPILATFTILVCLLLALAASPAAAAGTSVNVPGRDAAIALYDLGHGRAALYGFVCDGSASTRVKMWSGRLPVKRCKLAAGDFNSDGRTDAMVLVDLGKKRSRMLLFASNGKRFTQVAKWTSKRGAFNSAGASLAVGGFAKNAIDGTLVLRRASTGWVCDRFALQGKRLVVRRVLSKPGVTVTNGARLLAGEIDGDFRDEAVIASPSAAGLVLTMYRWDDVALTPMGGSATGLAVPARLWTCGDTDGDGLDEPAALVPDPATPGSSSLSAFNWDSGAFTAAGVVGDVAVPAAAQLGCADLNGDGFSDVLAFGSAGTGSSSLTVGVTGASGLTSQTFWTGKMSAARTRFACRRTLPTRVSDEVVVLPQTLDSGIVSRSDDNATIVFDGAPAEITALEPGNVILLSPSATLPEGICRIVDEVTSDGSQTTVTTSFAALTDIFQQVDINVHQENLIPAGAAVKGATTRRNGRSVELWKDIDYTMTDSSPGMYASFNMKGYVSLAFSGDISLRIRFPDHWYSPELYFMTYVQTVEKLDLDFAASAGYRNSFNTKLWEYTFPDIEFMIGPIPCWLTPKVGIDVYATVDAKTSVTWGFYQDATIKLGVEYCKGWKNLSEFSKTFSCDPLAIDGKADAKAGVRFRCAILLYSIIGPTAATGPYVRMHASVMENPFWRMYAGVDATVGVRLDNPVHDVVGNETYQYDWGPWKLYELQIAQASLKPGPVTPEAPITSMITPLSNGWVKGPVTLQFERQSDGTDPVSWTEWQLDGGAWRRIWPPNYDLWTLAHTASWLKVVVTTPGVHTVGYRSIDTNGDFELPQTCVVRIDPYPPSLTVTGAGSAYWYKTPTTLTLSALDAGSLSGMAGIECSDNGGSPTPGIVYWPLNKRTYGTLLIGDGVHQVSAIAVDQADNESPPQQMTVHVDSQAPITLVPGEPFLPSPTPRTLTFLATDSVSGVSYTEYSLDAGVTWTRGTSVTIGASGKTVVRYRSADKAENVESYRTCEVVIYDSDDVTPPTTTCSPSPQDYTYVGGNGEAVWSCAATGYWLSIGLKASDAASGVAKIEYLLQSRVTGTRWFSNWSNWKTVLPSASLQSVTLYAGNDYQLEYRATDYAGNVEETKAFLDPSLTADYFRVERPDVTPPTTTCSPDPQQHYSSAQIVAGKTTPLWIRTVELTVAFTAADAQSGVAKTEYRVQVKDSSGNWGAWGSWTTGASATFAAIPQAEQGSYRLEYRATDYAGNVETTKAFVNADDPSETDFFRVELPAPNDTTPPTTTCSPGPQDYTYVGSAGEAVWNAAAPGLGIRLEASDAASGVAKIEYRLHSRGTGTGWGFSPWSDWTTVLPSASLQSVTLYAGFDYQLEYRATDNAGNVETARAFLDPSLAADYFRVELPDVTPPTTTCSPDPQLHDSFAEIVAGKTTPLWIRALGLTVTFTAADAQSGVAKTEYRVQVKDSSGNWGAWGSWTTGASATFAAIPQAEQGSYRLEYRATDIAGNVETARAFLNEDDPSETDFFRVELPAPDVTPPTTTCSPDPRQHDSFAQIVAGKTTPLWIRAVGLTVAFTASDAESGVAKTEYRVQVKDSSGNWGAWGSWTTGASATFAAIPQAEQGSYRLEYRATDIAGNVETARAFLNEDDPSETDFFRVELPAPNDTTPPTTTCSPGPQEHDSFAVMVEGMTTPLWIRPDGLTLAFTALDAESGVESIEYRIQWENSDGYWLDWGAWVIGTSVTLDALPAYEWGSCRLEYQATDNAGNVETARAFVDQDDLTETDFFRVEAPLGE